jgi:hypothetical protein
MNLSQWIDKNGGTVKTGNLLKIKRNCVYAWRKGIALPRPEVMVLIKRKSAGKVTIDEMVTEYVGRRPKVRRKLADRKRRKKSAVTKVVRAVKRLDRAERAVVRATTKLTTQNRFGKTTAVKAAAMNGKKAKAKTKAPAKKKSTKKDPGF